MKELLGAVLEKEQPDDDAEKAGEERFPALQRWIGLRHGGREFAIRRCMSIGHCGKGTRPGHSKWPLEDPNVAAGKCSACGIAVVQTDRNSVRCSVLSIIRYTHIEPDCAAVVQTSRPAKGGAVTGDGKSLDSRFCDADAGGGITDGKRAQIVATSLRGLETKAGFVPLIVQSALAICVYGDHDARIIKFGACEIAVIESRRDEHQAVGQKGRGMIGPRCVEAASYCPGAGALIVEFRARWKA
jgi:hypothetical protein